MNDLEHAISIVGGVGKLAKALGVRQSTVSNWKARGRVPMGWSSLIHERYGGCTESEKNQTAAQQTPAVPAIKTEAKEVANGE